MAIFSLLPDVFRKLLADAWWPKVWGAGVASLLDYLLPLEASRELALAAGVLVLLDTATGVWAAFVSGRRVSSARFSRVFSKLLGYGSVMVVCGVATHVAPGAEALQPLAVSAVLGFVTMTEGISILENVGRMGVKAPPFLLDWLRKRLKERPSDEDSPEN